MRCISPFDSGSYHMVTIRTNRTNRQLGEGSLTILAPRNILSPPNEMHFSIRQRVVSTNAHLLRIDDSKATQQLFLRIVSIQVYWTTLISFGTTFQLRRSQYYRCPGTRYAFVSRFQHPPKQLEMRLIFQLGTVHPDGLNINFKYV